MKRALVTLLLPALVFACSDDTQTAPPNDTGNNTNNQNSQNDAGPDAAPDMSEQDVTLLPGKLEINQTLLTFSGVDQGTSATQTIVITNTGGEALLISDVTIGEIDRMGASEFTPGTNWISGATVIEGGTFVELDVLYSPNDFDTDRGTVTIESNDPDNPVFEVRIETINPYRDIDAPKFFNLGSVTPGMTGTERLFVYNRGGEPLTIDNIAYSGLGPFALDFSANTNQPNFPVIIERDEAYAVDVTYSPTDTSVGRGTITITSNDPDEATYEIAVSGNEPGPCIRVTPQVVSFGSQEPNTSATQTVTIFNCSDMLDLEMGTIEVSDDGGAVFVAENVPTLPVTIGPFQTATFDITAFSADEGARVGEVLLSTTGMQASQTVELRADFTQN